MPFSTHDLLLGVGLPAFLAAAIVLVLGWVKQLSEYRSLVLGIGFVVGYLTGFYALELGPLRPATHWHWLPWLAPIAIVPILIQPSRFRWALLGWVVAVGIVALCGWLIVPEWEDLEPSQAVLIPLFVVYVIGIDAALRPLPKLPSLATSVVIAGIFLAALPMLILAGSLRFAQIAGAAAGASLGLLCAVTLGRERSGRETGWLLYLVVLSGMLLVGWANSYSAIPAICYALIPIAPLGLWTGVWLRRREVRPWLVTSAAILVPALICSIALGIALAYDVGGEEY